MHRFDYSFLVTGLLPANLVNLTSEIYALREASITRKDKYKTAFKELEAVARIQSVKSSNAIEGIVTSDKRITEIVSGSSAPLNHTEAEIAGYRDALNLIHTNYENLSFKENDILLIHETMTSIAGYEGAGNYKKTANVILEVDSGGNRRIRFKPVSASETPKAMEQLELAYLEACSNGNINKLLLIPCVILDFLCIHPFSDGNGRMSRLLSLLLLYKNGFDAGKYVSFEEQINKYKNLYYDALQQSSSGWEFNGNNYSPFIQNFIFTLYLCYKELNKRFTALEGNKNTKKSLVEATVLGSLHPISKAEICALLPDISPTTIEAVLGAMVKEGRIERIGSPRTSKYFRNS